MTPVLLHLSEDEVAAADSFVRIEEGRIGDRALGQAGKQSRFSEVEIFGVLGEVILRGGLKAVHAAAEVDLVAVEGKDLLLGEGALDLDGKIGLLNFARGGALGGEKEVAGQLHGERGCALRAAMAADVVPGGTGDAKDVDAPVRFEALVFDRDHGLAQNRREVVVVDHFAALQGEGADNAALAVVEVGGGGGAEALEVVNLRQIGGVDQREAGQRTGDDGQQQQSGQGEFAGQLAAMRRRLRLKPEAPAKAARLIRLDGFHFQANQTSWAWLCRMQQENAPCPRLAWEDC